MAIVSFHKMANFHLETVSTPTKPLTGFTITQTVAGSSTVKETRTIQCITESAGNLNFMGFNMSSALNKRNFYFYFKVDNIDRDPSFMDREGKGIYIASDTTAENIAIALSNYINSSLSSFFTATVIGDTVTVVNYQTGECLAASDGSDTTYDLNTMGLTTLKSVTGWTWYTVGGGNVGSELKRKKYHRFIIDIAGWDIGWGY